MATTEQEVLSRWKQSMSEGKHACVMLAKNADPEYIALRGTWYQKLKRACKELEGCAKQMSVYRDGDARWLPLGILYGAKVQRLAQRYYTDLNWIAFGKLIQVFEQGERRAGELEQKKTGRTGAILPVDPSSWLNVPDFKPDQPNRLILPSRGTLH